MQEVAVDIVQNNKPNEASSIFVEVCISYPSLRSQRGKKGRRKKKFFKIDMLTCRNCSKGVCDKKKLEKWLKTLLNL